MDFFSFFFLSRTHTDVPSKSSAFCRLARGPILIKIRMHDNTQAESVTERQPHERSHTPARLVPEQRASNPFVAFGSYILKRYTSSVIAVTRLMSHQPLRSCRAGAREGRDTVAVKMFPLLEQTWAARRCLTKASPPLATQHNTTQHERAGRFITAQASPLRTGGSY